MCIELHPAAPRCVHACSRASLREHANPYTRIGINIECTQGRQRQRQQQRRRQGIGQKKQKDGKDNQTACVLCTLDVARDEQTDLTDDAGS